MKTNIPRGLVWLGVVAILAGRALAGDARSATNAAAGSGTTSVAVVTLRYQGWKGGRQSTEPSLQVYQDGRVHFGSPYGTTQPLDAKLSEEELGALLRFILVEQEFAKFDAASLREELATAAAKNPGRVTRLMDASTMVLAVRDGEQKHEVTVHALETMAVAFPELTRLRQLLTIQRRLEKLRAEAYAGGPEEIARHLEKANARLAEDYPDAAPLKPEDLEQAWQSVGGRRVVKFLRSEPLTGNFVRLTKAEIDYPVFGDPVVITRVSTVEMP